MCISYLSCLLESDYVFKSIYLSAINLTPINFPFLIVYLSLFQYSENTAQSGQRFSGDELEAWFKPEKMWFASGFCTQWTLIWCITEVLNCSGSPQPQNYTAAVGFRCNWLGSILDDTIRAASKQNGIGYNKLNNLAHNMNPSISPKITQPNAFIVSPADSLTPTCWQTLSKVKFILHLLIIFK